MKHKNAGNKSRCLPSEKKTGSFPAGASAMSNGNALHRLLLRVICSGQPLPPHTQAVSFGYGMWVRTAWGLDTNYGPEFRQPVPARTLHGSAFGTTDQVTVDVVE